MNTSRIILGLLVGGLTLCGCKKETEKQVAPAPAPQTSTPTTPVTPATLPSVTITPPVAPPVVTPSTPVTPPPTNDSTATSSGGSADADAKTLLKQFSADVADKKWDAASADLKKLNDMRPQLSQTMKDAVTKAEEKYAAAKVGSALKLPSLGGATTAPSDLIPNK